MIRVEPQKSGEEAYRRCSPMRLELKGGQEDLEFCFQTFLIETVAGVRFDHLMVHELGDL